jgi:two-component system alkaline phosphatase synthesis response regulator PhoP
MAGADRRVLIVEDDPDIVDYLSFFLEDEGYEVEAASRCSTAREMMDDFRPEVILIDALLPGKSGGCRDRQ